MKMHNKSGVSSDFIHLKFRKIGGPYARAVEVANFMGIDIEEYLLLCIEEGHKVYKHRMQQDLEIPTIFRK